MPHRCISGGCSNTRKDGVSLHKWPEDRHFAKLWTNAVKHTRSDFFNPTTSRLCSVHFSADCFEEQSVIAKSLGLKMKNLLKPDAVPSIFKSGPPETKKQRREDDNVSTSHEVRAGPSKQKPLRGAYRKREAARILAEHEKEESQSPSGENNDGLQSAADAAEILPGVQEVATQTLRTGKDASVQFRSSRTAKGKFGSFLMRNKFESNAFSLLSINISRTLAIHTKELKE
ncbi:THAP domain containing 10 [Desmophyllum pertusum]|uniref:THAP domain containing 10 n=1 Tax=Desmophyllum pertusum TaxID=174260 RepID=A0A9X0CR39_9CNID|nr:THAP domain containing 10 [Desmophyllum pertusum]